MAASGWVKVLTEGLARRMKEESFDRLLNNLKFISASDGRVVCEIKVDDRHKNMHGSVHGGMICTLVDVVTSFALLTKNCRGVSVDLNVSFTKAVEIGHTIEIDAKLLKVGKHMAFANALLRDQTSKKILAAGRQSLFITHQNVTPEEGFLSSAKLGSDLQIDAKVLKVGNHLAFLSADIRDKISNKILAEGRHTKYITQSNVTN